MSRCNGQATTYGMVYLYSCRAMLGVLLARHIEMAVTIFILAVKVLLDYIIT